MAVCEVCGIYKSERIIAQIPMCGKCFEELQKLRDGDLDILKKYLDESLPSMSPRAREYFGNTARMKYDEYHRMQEEKMKLELQVMQEEKKQSFAKSFGEIYEYDVVTLINKNHGTVDKDKMMEILMEHSRKGWKLHTIYSNELGKNALSVLGLGINATACEDVMIFERRVKEIDE